MNQPRQAIIFENNSITSAAQHKVVQKLGTHFGIPQKMIRAAVDVDSLKRLNLLRFPQLADFFSTEFYPIEYSIKRALSELSSEAKFEQGGLLEQLRMNLTEDAVVVLVHGSDIRALVPFHTLPTGVGVVGVYIDFGQLGQPHLLLPLTQYLRIQHPSPS